MTRLTIDDDAVFDSIMNSLRTIKEIKLDVLTSKVELTERQLDRVTAVVNRFAASITSLELKGFSISINSILELLHQAPKLESLTFIRGRAFGSATDKTNVSSQMPKLKVLEISDFAGLLDIVNLIPVGSLNYYSENNIDDSTEILQNILTKQHNIKSLILFSYCEPNVLCVNHLQLETLLLGWKLNYSNDELMEVLKCHTNLKELRLRRSLMLSDSYFNWICGNLKKLEVLEVYRLETNVFKMLGELKHLRHFRTDGWDNLLGHGFQFKSDSLEKIEIFHPSSFHNGQPTSRKYFCCGELLNKMVRSLVKNFASLTGLQIRFDDFSALIFVLSHCTTINHLSCFINNPSPDQLKQLRFPNIKQLKLSSGYLNDASRTQISQIMSIVSRAMPNLKSLTMAISGLIFDLSLLREFINGSESLDYLYVDCFELDKEVSACDFVGAIRRLLYQLKTYQLMFTTRSRSPGVRELNRNVLKDILSNEFNVRDVTWNSSCISLYRGGTKKFYFY